MNPTFGSVDFDDEPVSLELAWSHLAIDPNEESPPSSPHDLWLTEIGIPAAREAAENFTGLALAPKQAIYRYDRFVDIEPIRIQPFIGIDSIEYKDAEGNPATFTDYALSTDWYGDVTITGDWPSGSEVVIKANVGGDAPKAAVQGILLILGNAFRNREATTERQAFDLPFGVDALLRPLRVRRGMA